MAIKPPTNRTFSLFLLSTFLLGALLKPGLGAVPLQLLHQNLVPPLKVLQSERVERDGLWKWREKNSARRLMIGSTAPTCTYNECRGCRFKCRAEQVPVDANDPINSAYRYRCVCHR